MGRTELVTILGNVNGPLDKLSALVRDNGYRSFWRVTGRATAGGKVKELFIQPVFHQAIEIHTQSCFACYRLFKKPVGMWVNV